MKYTFYYHGKKHTSESAVNIRKIAVSYLKKDKGKYRHNEVKIYKGNSDVEWGSIIDEGYRFIFEPMDNGKVAFYVLNLNGTLGSAYKW